MDSEHRYAFVAMFDGKKVKKYIKSMEEIVGIKWITETKFWFRDENDAYYEGIILAKDENEQTLRDRVSKKSPRIPHNAFKPFPDPNVQPTSLVEKWKKRLTTRDDNILESILKRLRQEYNPKLFAESEKRRKSSVETMNDGGENGSTFIKKEHKVNHTPVAEEKKSTTMAKEAPNEVFT
ncbi:hypothetical protein evm_009496 [Chilo suppressalis]|nr:hypothetical protein evm_009496 [Chilo suppressalis]